MAESPLRKLILRSMLQKQQEGREQQQKCTMALRITPPELFCAIDCDNFAQPLGK